MTTDAYHLDGDIIRADDGTWCQPATAIEKQLFAAAAVSAADNAALRAENERLREWLENIAALHDYFAATGVLADRLYEAKTMALAALGNKDAKYAPMGALRKRVEELEAASQWRPIETAPKDGRKMLLTYKNRNGKRRTVVGGWVTDEEAAETDTDGVGLEAGWYERIDNWDDYYQIAIHEGEPDHWMPLPSQPKEPKHG